VWSRVGVVVDDAVPPAEASAASLQRVVAKLRGDAR
jgi:hypothetical protein